MFPRSGQSKKPIKLGTNSKKMNDMNAFIDSELKIMQSIMWKIPSHIKVIIFNLFHSSLVRGKVSEGSSSY